MISHSQKADVYSWSMVTYELLTLQKPFAVGSIEQHKKAVCERGERPPMGHLRWLSPSVKELLENSWQADVQARWHMRDIKDSLDTIIKDVESSKGFRRDGSFGSFGYGNKHANGKAPSSSFTLCQGTEVDDMIVDFTNAVQTRYENVTGFLFCNGQRDTTTASGVADSEAALSNEKQNIGNPNLYYDIVRLPHTLTVFVCLQIHYAGEVDVDLLAAKFAALSNELEIETTSDIYFALRTGKNESDAPKGICIKYKEE